MTARLVVTLFAVVGAAALPMDAQGETCDARTCVPKKGSAMMQMKAIKSRTQDIQLPPDFEDKTTKAPTVAPTKAPTPTRRRRDQIYEIRRTIKRQGGKISKMGKAVKRSAARIKELETASTWTVPPVPTDPKMLSCPSSAPYIPEKPGFPGGCPCSPAECEQTWACFEAFIQAVDQEAQSACKKALQRVDNKNAPVTEYEFNCCNHVLKGCNNAQPLCYANFTKHWFSDFSSRTWMTPSLEQTSSSVAKSDSRDMLGAQAGLILEGSQGHGARAKATRRGLFQRNSSQVAETAQGGMDSLSQISMDNSLRGKCA